MKKRFFLSLLYMAGICALGATICYGVFFTTAYDGDQKAYIYLTELEDHSAVQQKLDEAGVRTTGFQLLLTMKPYQVRSGRYAIYPGDDLFHLYRRLCNGLQEPVRLTLPSVRTMDRLAGAICNRIMIDSADVAAAFRDPAFCDRYGYTPETLPALFIPNTYEVYWDTSLDGLMLRMQKEYSRFWTAERDSLAQAAGLTRTEVATLASIIDEETANNAEKPMVAGMYIRRLQIGMPLQADPTVKFALGDFALRRILHTHLTVDSPYNTYLHEGLPPGPIRIASIAGLDAVLHHVHHNYIYMCAKEDFSGTHNFAATYDEHLRNAHRYAKALNARGIR